MLEPDVASISGGRHIDGALFFSVGPVMTVIWILLATKIIFCAAAAAPTLFFLRSGGWLKKTYRRRVQRRLEAALTKLSVDFSSNESFFAEGVGFAVDFCHRRFFVAERDGGKTKGAILPFSALRNVATGQMNQNGFYDIYIELTVDDPKHPSWRLLLGENNELRRALNATLARLQAPDGCMSTSGAPPAHTTQ